MAHIEGYSATKRVETTKPKIESTEAKVETKTEVNNGGGSTSKKGFVSFAGSMVKAKLAQTSFTKTNQAQTVNVTPEENAQIQEGVEQVWKELGSGEGNATVELASQLRGQSADYQAEFIRQLNDTITPYNTQRLLNIAGGETPWHISDARPSESDSRVIARAIGNAYDRGTIGNEFIQEALEYSKTPGNNHYLGNIIGQSNSQALKEAFFDESMALYSPDKPGYYGSTETFISGAANAIAGDPELLQTKLAEMSANGTLNDFLDNLDPKKFNTAVIAEYDNAYAKLIETAARIQPPTAEVAELFEYTSNNYLGGSYNDRYGMADAMTKLFTGGNWERHELPNGQIIDQTFHSNAEFLMLELSKYGEQDDGTGADSTAVLALSKFFANTAFNDKFEQNELVMDVAQREINKLRTAIENYPNINSTTKELIDASTNPGDPNGDEVYQIQEQMAYRLGRITSGVFRGFEIAVKDRNDYNASIDKMVDFVFGIIPFSKAKSAAGKIPGVGSVASLATDQAIKAGKQALKDWLHDRDLNEDRREIFDLLIDVSGTFTPDLADDFFNGYGNVIDLALDLKNK